MKPTLFLLALFALNITFAQNFQELADTKFNSPTDYKNAERNIVVASNYLFDTPYYEGDLNRINALKFINKWMQGTTNHTFKIDNKATSLTEGDATFLNLYNAGLAKVSIENSGKKLSPDALHNKIEMLLVDYCSDKKNKLKPNNTIKALIKKSK